MAQTKGEPGLRCTAGRGRLGDTLGEAPGESSVAMELAVSVPGALRVPMGVGKRLGVPVNVPLGVGVTHTEKVLVGLVL